MESRLAEPTKCAGCSRRCLSMELPCLSMREDSKLNGILDSLKSLDKLKCKLPRRVCDGDSQVGHARCLTMWTSWSAHVLTLALVPQVTKGGWTGPEDDYLRHLFIEFSGQWKTEDELGKSRVWAGIAARMPERNVKQCRKRWHLDSRIRKGPHSVRRRGKGAGTAEAREQTV